MPGDTIPTNMRLLLVIEAIASAGIPVTPTSVNETLGLPKPTIHRLFATLEQEGFVQRDMDGRHYSPGPRLRLLAGGIMSTRRARTARLAILQQLSRKIGETCNIALPDRDAMAYLERVETEWPLRIQLPIGTRVPFYCTASGKMYLSTLSPAHLRSYLGAVDLTPHTANTICDETALLAELDEIRRADFALDRAEFMEDMIALAVPIRDSHQRMMATLSFHAPTQRFDAAQAQAQLETLRAASLQLSALIDDLPDDTPTDPAPAQGAS